MQFSNYLAKFYNLEQNNALYYQILALIAGCFFYLFYGESCNYYLFLIIIIFAIAIIIYSVNKYFIYSLLIFFIIGILYCLVYNRIIVNNKFYDDKIYISGTGRIIDIRYFYNKINHQKDTNFILNDLQIKKLEFKGNLLNQNLVKKPSKISNKNNYKKKKVLKKKIKKTYKKKKVLKKNTLKKVKKISKTFAKKIYNNYINIPNYTELDRKTDDLKRYIKYYINDDKDLSSINKISLRLASKNNFLINDVIAFNAVILPLKNPNFNTDFNLKLDAIVKQIDGFGFMITLPKIIFKKSPDKIDVWFIDLRQKIKNNILKYLQDDEASLIMALLIGDSENISKETLSAIRNAGLSHLLSISGFHLSLASAIFFIIIRIFVSRIFSLALIYDSKKIASIFAIIASFFYLKIANAPLPAQRALIIVWLLMISYILELRFDGKRAIFFALLILTLFNPYNLTQVGFQLSFIGVLVMIIYFESYRKIIFPYAYFDMDKKLLTTRLTKIKLYFFEILVVTFLIQLATLPIVMHNFRIFSFSAFLANLFAIPIISFVIMPLAFLSLFLMLFKIEFIAFFLLKYFAIIFIELSYFFNDFRFAFIKLPAINNLYYFISIFSIIIFLVSYNNFIKLLMIIILLINISSVFIPIKTQITFDKKQNFFGIYDEKNLYFSKNLKFSNQIKNWYRHYELQGAKVLQNCNNSALNQNCQKCYRNYCEVYYAKHKILLLRKRVNIKKICKLINKNNYNAIINFTKKYELPACAKFNKEMIVIDNEDFIKSLLNPKIYF